ncbi:MAG TPA: ATP-binding protein [Gammaproteobacteria bacterium]|nr:ATP-binding protein [Gammaproteobacteria bacterium]
MPTLRQLRDRLRFLALYRAGDAESERMLAALAAESDNAPEPFGQLSDMVAALTALDPACLPVAVVCLGVEDPQDAVLQLLASRPDVHVAVMTAPDERRSLGDYFRHRRLPAHQVELLPGREQEIAARLRAIGEAIAQRAAHQQALRRTSERLAGAQPHALDLTAEPVQQAIMESLPTGLIVLNPAGYVVQANTRARQMLRRPGSGETTVPPAAEHISVLLPQWTEVADAAATGTEQTVTMIADGRLRHLRVRSMPLGGASDSLGTVITVEDVTTQERARRMLKASSEELQSRVIRESRQLEEVRRERDAIRNFIVTLSHDLRSPIAAADAYLQVLHKRAKTAGADWATKLVERIRQNLKRTNRMVENLLDVARHDAGAQLEVRLQPSRLDRLVAEAVEDLQRVHGRHFRVRQPVPAAAGQWDPDGIRRIIENLGNNAAKHGDPSRSIDLWVQDTRHYALLNIRNYGSPIPIEAQRTLFEPFYRAALAGADAVQGWGVGLAFVRAMTERHGGSVSVVSNEESGTIFTVKLPKRPPIGSNTSEHFPEDGNGAGSA